MSDIFYNGGGGDAGNINVNTVVDNSGNYSSSGAPAGVQYDYSNLQTYNKSANDLITSAGNDLGKLTNPYQKTVQVGILSIDRYVYQLEYDQYGNPYYVREYNGTSTYKVYGANPAYYQFETTLKTAQTSAYQTNYDAGQIINDKTAQANLSNLEDGHDNGLYGAGTLGIDELAQNITYLQKQISDLQLADTLSSEYNRIDDTDHSKEIAALQAELGAFKNQYDSAIDDYQSRYALAKARQNEASASEWDVSYGWATDPTFDASFHFNMGVRQDINGFTNLLLSGDINSWMAGGNLYDAPRAGDVMFNIIGNMNTVRFLGIEDTNRIPNIVTEFANPEVFRVLGNMAGDSNFSIIPPTVYS